MKERIYLGGGVNRVACEPIWETEAREARERYEAGLDPESIASRGRPENVVNHYKNLHGAKGVEGLTGRWRGKSYIRGVPRT